MTRTVKLQHIHDCRDCLFLGQDNGCDLYFCKQHGLPTVIARWGDGGPDYVSGLDLARAIEADPKKQLPGISSLVRALELARERNLVE